MTSLAAALLHTRYLNSEEIRGQAQNATVPLFLGRRFAQGGNMQRVFNSGGAGYVSVHGPRCACICSIAAFPWGAVTNVCVSPLYRVSVDPELPFASVPGIERPRQPQVQSRAPRVLGGRAGAVQAALLAHAPCFAHTQCSSCNRVPSPPQSSKRVVQSVSCASLCVFVLHNDRSPHASGKLCKLRRTTRVTRWGVSASTRSLLLSIWRTACRSTSKVIGTRSTPLISRTAWTAAPISPSPSTTSSTGLCHGSTRCCTPAGSSHGHRLQRGESSRGMRESWGGGREGGRGAGAWLRCGRRGAEPEAKVENANGDGSGGCTMMD